MDRKMTWGLALAAACGLCLTISLPVHGAAPAAEAPPAWVYPMSPRSPPRVGPPPPDTPFSVPSSALTLTHAQITMFAPPDWHPQDHPAMPPIVAVGHSPGVHACGYCHLPSGQGRPENAKLAGLPVDYFIRQMADFKSGARTQTVAHRAPFDLMVGNAKAVSDAEIAQAAAYFASVTPTSKVKVIESATAPKTFDKGWILTKAEEGGTEPLGMRIIETPDDIELFDKRDAFSVILAYVPPGSIAKGRALATGHGAHPEVACVACHGAKLNGTDEIPGLAGRSPSFIARQLYDFRSGARHGEMAAPMQAVAESLSAEDIVDAAAYLASAKPGPAG